VEGGFPQANQIHHWLYLAVHGWPLHLKGKKIAKQRVPPVIHKSRLYQYEDQGRNALERGVTSKRRPCRGGRDQRTKTKEGGGGGGKQGSRVRIERNFWYS